MSQNPIPLPVIQQEGFREPGYSCALWSSRVLMGFVVLVSAILLGSVLREHRRGLLVNDRIGQLQAQLAMEKGNVQLQGEIRKEDQRLREMYFARRVFWERGAEMLGVGGVLMAAAIYLAGRWGYKPFMPMGPMPKGPRLDAKMKTGIALATLGLGAFGLMAGWPVERVDYRHKETKAPTLEAVVPGASDEEMAKNWPMFRGHRGTGHVLDGGNYPTQWDGKEKLNIAWTVELEQGGVSSPIVWGNQVFIACGDEKKRQIVSYDAETGKKMWAVGTSEDFGERMKIMEETTFAPSTPATDGKRVFAVFPTGEFLAADFSGKQIWKKQLGIPDNMYGHASSLLIYNGILVVQYDQGVEADEGKFSKAYGFDSATGKELWKINRPVSASWSTPMAYESGGKTQVVMLGIPWTIGYDLKSGAELWRTKGMGGELTPSPTFAEGKVVSAMGGKYLFVINPDGRGDVTESHQKKIDIEPLPDIVSPLAVGNRALLFNGGGLAGWIDLEAGKTVWEHDFDHGIHASPIAVGDRIYLIDNDGKAHVIQIGDEFKEIAVNEIEDEIRATPAFAGGKIFIRGKKTLYCIK